jgi:hypothetical protein
VRRLVFAGRVFAGLVIAGFVWGQTSLGTDPPPGDRPLAENASEPPDSAYLLPQTVYVGDTGRLVVPLDAAFSAAGNMTLDRPEQLPSPGDLVISRVTLENRGGRARLLVDFTAYVPGPIALLPVKIGPYVFSGLEVHIASILDADTLENSSVLSPYAPPLPVPGTMGIIYAFTLGIIFLVLGSVFLRAWGLPWFLRFRELLKRRRMIRFLFRSVGELRELLAGDDRAGGAALDRLNGDLRRFLEFFTRQPCTSMAPGEFLSLAGPGGKYGLFLNGLFGRCDGLRFGGGEVSSGEALAILDEVQDFAAAYAKEEEAAAALAGGQTPHTGTDPSRGDRPHTGDRPSPGTDPHTGTDPRREQTPTPGTDPRTRGQPSHTGTDPRTRGQTPSPGTALTHGDRPPPGTDPHTGMEALNDPRL